VIDFHKHFLGDVFCVVMVVYKPECEIVDPSHMQLDKFSKRIMASFLHIQYQLPLPVSGHSEDFLIRFSGIRRHSR